ncbi:MAG: glutamine-hydrolyzing GMP synthase, partial [Saccharofermentans sp.]|nr:glutamine-hydrolyzing GMP synthase [Saccharofermentans sp.]
MDKEKIIVLDFGGQYNQLIARRVRELSVYSEVLSSDTPIEKLIDMKPTGIILTGGPNSVYKDGSPRYDPKLFELEIPILGICYGAQLMTYLLGGKVETAPVSEYGHTDVNIVKGDDILFGGVSPKTVCWMSHTDYISQAPEGFTVTAS